MWVDLSAEWSSLRGQKGAASVWILHCVQNDRDASFPPLATIPEDVLDSSGRNPGGRAASRHHSCAGKAVGSRLHGSGDCVIHVAGRDAVCFNWAVMTNALYYGDNLDILREHVPDESVDLVYLDPPFNSNASYNVLFKEQSGEESPAQIRAFNDTWQWTQESQRTFENEIMLNPATPANVREMVNAFRQFIGSNAMMAYLVMMTPRLVELRRVLKPTGSIYLHCDPTASHYLKVLMDAVFGKEHFRNEITWRRYGAHNDVGQGSTRFGRVHDIILLYGKTDSVAWNQEFTALDENYVKSTYRYVDEDTGRRFRTTPLTGPGGAEKGNPVYEWNGHVRAWRYSLETMKQLDAALKAVFTTLGLDIPAAKRFWTILVVYPSKICGQTYTRCLVPTLSALAIPPRSHWPCWSALSRRPPTRVTWCWTPSAAAAPPLPPPRSSIAAGLALTSPTWPLPS